MPRLAPNTPPLGIPSRVARSPLIPLPEPDHNPVKIQLERILNSRIFAGAHRSQIFLRHVVEHTITHPDVPLKEYSIALDVFDRDPSYDPAVDATVRVEAGRLRSRLLEYYVGEGQADPLLIEIPRGRYRAVIHPRQAPAATVPPPLPLVSLKRTSVGAQRERRPWVLPAAFLLGALLARRASH